MAADIEFDIGPLANAVQRLQEGFERHQREPADEQLRDDLIQRFEFACQLRYRMLRRFLRHVAASPEAYDQMSSRPDQVSLLLRDWTAWRRYRDMRGKTSHTYSASVAAEVIGGIPGFLAEAAHLCNQIRWRLA